MSEFDLKSEPSKDPKNSTASNKKEQENIETLVAPQNNEMLQGNCAPVIKEQVSKNLKVTGYIPKALNGRLMRNGPNPVNPGLNYHWFVGDAMIHSIEIANGAARSYRNRWVRTDQLEKACGLEAAPKSKNVPFIQGSPMVHVISHGEEILALPEAGLPYQLDTELNTIGQFDFDGKFFGNMTAHPTADPDTGELFMFGYGFTAPLLKYHVADANCKLKTTVDLDLPAPIMMHDFGVTKSRVVFMDLPLIFDATLLQKGYKIPYRWSNEHQARLGIAPRSLGTKIDGESKGDANAMIQWIDIDPCFVFHVVNCYDQGNDIVMDVIRYPKMFSTGKLDGFDMEEPSQLVRWLISPEGKRVESTIISTISQEFPTLNPSYICSKHQYCYTLDLNDGGLLKHDFVSGEHQYHDFGEGRSSSEGVFVSTATVGDAEDKGYVLSVVYDEKTHSSEMIILDAQNFEAPPIAVIDLGVRVPVGFHGSFIAA